LTFRKHLTKDDVKVLESIVKLSAGDGMDRVLKKMTAGDFFDYCRMGYVANDYFKDDENKLSSMEMYKRMADGWLLVLDGSSCVRVLETVKMLSSEIATTMGVILPLQ